MKNLLAIIYSCIFPVLLYAQQHTIKGKVFDAISKEPINGAKVGDNAGHNAVTGSNGVFLLTTNETAVYITFPGYDTLTTNAIASVSIDIALQPADKKLQQVIVTASKTAQKRSEAPVAISVLNAQTLAETKANRLDQVVNKAAGVFMVNLGNEQHEMSIRQPMTTKGLFLYLEDGVPIRTTGLYNHNALLEMNMASTKQIEIIRGPASSLYGAEAIGGAVNLITLAPPAITSGQASVVINNTGYKRADLQAGTTMGKWGIIASGYYANKHDGPIAYSDYHKSTFTIRADYRPTDKTTWSNSIAYTDYYSDMTGALDSAHFANKDYSTPYSFTYRKVNALRIKSQLTQQWNTNSSTQITAMYRDNSVKQNPSYSIANSRTNPLLANGQENNSSFNSYVFIAQHQQSFNWLNSKIIAGVSSDISPSKYRAQYIRVQRDAKGNYTSFVPTDSVMSNYNTGISNVASYVHMELSPLNRLKVVAALRYDYYHYNFTNYLPASASTGAPSSKTDYNRFTPKVGVTYNYRTVGFYANYSQGYVPPQISELFNSVKVPYLQPQLFNSYEIGGWLSLIQNKLYAEWSVYLMNGTNEIISVRMDDGTTQNQNAGRTRHKGIEYGITYKPTSEWMIRLSATNARHTFVENVEKTGDYSGNVMSNAPAFIANAEVTYKPHYIKGFRIGAEWQHLDKYWMDNANTTQYNGFDVINLRAGYRYKRAEIWVNAMNVLNKYYAVIATKSAYGYSYNLGDPREWNVGVAYHF